MSRVASSAERGRPGERSGPAHQRLDLVDGDRLERDHRHDLLGQHVERVARIAHRLDRAVAHPLGDHGALEQVAAELREDHAPADRADLVPGPADPLQPGRDRRRRLDLHDQVDRAHVDAELEAGRRDDRGQPAGLEVLLDQGALLARHRPVVRPRDDHLLGRRAGAGLRHHLRGRGVVELLHAGALGGQLVQPGGQAFGQPAGVGEHDGRAVLLDEIEHPFLDVRPDAGAVAGAGGRAGEILGELAEVAHVLDGHDDL